MATIKINITTTKKYSLKLQLVCICYSYLHIHEQMRHPVLDKQKEKFVPKNMPMIAKFRKVQCQGWYQQ